VFQNIQPPLGERMRRSARSAGFTLKDLSIWLDRPYRRVQAWFSRDCVPRPPDYEHVVVSLRLLNLAVRGRSLGAVRLTTRREERRTEIRRAYRAIRRAHVTKRHSAK